MKQNQSGYVISVLGTALILIWVGLFKFTPSEAEGIKPLVSNHFAMSWMYKVMSVQAVSNIIGFYEVVTGIGLVIALINKKVGVFFGMASVIIFVVTMSFLFTTPDTFKFVDGFPITNFFILKDLSCLGISLMVYFNGKSS